MPNGTGNDIVLSAQQGIYMSGSGVTGEGATILTRTINTQTGGNISLTAAIVEMADGADLLSLNPGGGRAGNIEVNASTALVLSGNDLDGDNVDQANIQAISASAGQAGAIDINVARLDLLDAAKNSKR